MVYIEFIFLVHSSARYIICVQLQYIYNYLNTYFQMLKHLKDFTVIYISDISQKLCKNESIQMANLFN